MMETRGSNIFIKEKFISGDNEPMTLDNEDLPESSNKKCVDDLHKDGKNEENLFDEEKL